VVVFALNDREYRRWLQLEALERRTPPQEAELRGYLDTMDAAERKVRQWLVGFFQAELERHCRQGCGAERAEIYRVVAPRLPARWGARQIARLYGECRPGDDVYAGKMLILDEALEALCGSGRVECVPGPCGTATYRWSAGPRPEQEPAAATRRPARQEAGSPPPAAKTSRPDLRELLPSLGRFVGFDE
jgi:hypothetical protein